MKAGYKVTNRGRRRLRSPIKWFGGKGAMTAKLLPLVPEHRTYVEVFGGGASLLFAKEPSLVEVYNDLDSGLVNFFRVLREPAGYERFYELVRNTPYSREEYAFCRDTWEECADYVERAYRWFVVARMSFSGRFAKGWSSVVTASSRGMACSVSSWMGAMEMLPLVRERLMRVQVEHSDFRNVLRRYDTPDTFFYLDPPYVPETRRGGGYRCELSAEDHEELVNILLELKGRAMVSGYAHPVYEPLEAAGWVRRDFRVACQAVGRTRAAGLVGAGSVLERQIRTESVWMNWKA